MNCTKCAKEISIDAKFCLHCGNRTKFSIPKKCIKCSIDIKLGAKFCSHCGDKIEYMTPKKCPECAKEIIPGVKFCRYCGIQFNIINQNLQDILNKNILTTELIYDATDIQDKKLNIKLNTPLIGLNGLKIKNHILKDYHHLSRFCFDFNSSGEFNLDMINLISNFNNIPSSIISRIIIKNPLLELCKINHSIFYNGDNNTMPLKYEKFHHVLIGLIENKIKKPRCGYDIIATSDIDIINLKNKISEDEIKKNINILNQSISITIDYHNKFYFDATYEQKLIDDKIIDKIDKDIITNSIADYLFILSKYEEAQIILDNLLDQITFPIFYSKKSKKIYKLEDLYDEFKSLYDNTGDLSYLNFDEKKYCEKIQINHVDIFIINDEIENILYVVDIKQKTNKAMLLFKPIPDEIII